MYNLDIEIYLTLETIQNRLYSTIPALAGIPYKSNKDKEKWEKHTECLFNFDEFNRVPLKTMLPVYFAQTYTKHTTQNPTEFQIIIQHKTGKIAFGITSLLEIMNRTKKLFTPTQLKIYRTAFVEVPTMQPVPVPVPTVSGKVPPPPKKRTYKPRTKKPPVAQVPVWRKVWLGFTSNFARTFMI